jgi:hypothetical protein
MIPGLIWPDSAAGYAAANSSSCPDTIQGLDERGGSVPFFRFSRVPYANALPALAGPDEA